MDIFILADEKQKKEILSIPSTGKASIFFASSFREVDMSKEFDAFFILSNERNSNVEIFRGKPVFINQVIDTLDDCGYPGNVSRINGWPGFLERPLWEAVSNEKFKNELILNAMGRKVIFVKDEPGFVSARVISMIINEAFFAFGENISTVEEIDLAMKLGTNYPNGPFEWAEKIGIPAIYLLLQKLAIKEERYEPAPALKKLYFELLEKNK